MRRQPGRIKLQRRLPIVLSTSSLASKIYSGRLFCQSLPRLAISSERLRGYYSSVATKRPIICCAHWWGLLYPTTRQWRAAYGLQDAELTEDIVMNGVGFVGRMVPAYFADNHFGPLNTLIPFVFVSGLLIYCWAAVKSSGRFGKPSI